MWYLWVDHSGSVHRTSELWCSLAILSQPWETYACENEKWKKVIQKRFKVYTTFGCGLRDVKVALILRYKTIINTLIPTLHGGHSLEYIGRCRCLTKHLHSSRRDNALTWGICGTMCVALGWKVGKSNPCIPRENNTNWVRDIYGSMLLRLL